MTHHLLYWRPSTVETHQPDQILWWAGSDQLKGDRVQPGDIIWAVTSPEANELRLVARIPADQVVHTRVEAVARVGEIAWRETEHFVIGREDDCRAKQDIDLSEVARRLVFEGGVDRLPKDFDGKNLQTMRRLTPESAVVLQRAWEDGEASKPPRFVWQRDELILALDLYLRLDRGVPHPTDPEVLELSALLRSLPIHLDREADPLFRNPDGVALKLANFHAIEQPGRGMSRGNRLEQVVWDEFAGDPERLRRTAALITAGALTEAGQEQVAPQDEEEEFSEGRIAYRLHKRRERSRELVRRKKQQVRTATGALACEACRFDFEARYGELGKDYIECHHTIPVSELPEGAKTRLEDVVLVCSNCHRMLHRMPKLLAAHDVKGLFVVV